MNDPDRHATGSGHAGTDALAELAEGLLDDGSARSVQAHLESCPECRARRDALADLPSLLAATPPAGPVPAEVADRLDRALRDATGPVGAGEPATAEASAGVRAPATPAATVTPLVARDRTPWTMRLLQTAAVLVLLLGGLGIVWGAVQGGGGDSATSTAGRAAGGGQERAADSGSYPVLASGRNWSPDSIEAGVPDLVAGRLTPLSAADLEGSSPEAASPDRGEPTGQASAGVPPGDTADLAGGTALAECVGNLNLGPVTPLAVDLARWSGNPAAVIVLPTPDDPASADVFVVAPDCPAGQFLYFARVARP